MSDAAVRSVHDDLKEEAVPVGWSTFLSALVIRRLDLVAAGA
jgi:hypothetical protein